MARYRFIIALDLEASSLEKAESWKNSIANLIWSEVCSMDEPMPKILDVYEVKE
jgi:hypothetical protein